MEEQALPSLLITNLTNIFYLTGFRGSAGAALFTRREGVLWVDPRYTLQAREQARHVEVLEEKKGVHKAAAVWIASRRLGPTGYEAAHLSCADFARLERAAGPGAQFVATAGLVECVRKTKDVGEIARIRSAGRITARVFSKVLRSLQPGASEVDLAAEIDWLMRRAGAEGAAFETIVASGPRAALPHARPSPKLLKQNEFVIFDLGAILDGYVADMSRTVYLGEPSRRARSIYNAVAEAQERGIKAALPGVRCREIDALARRCLAGHGLARFFTHSTGHGVGTEPHELPRLARGEKARLEADQVVTVEPGVYFEGWGGVRVEDTILVTPAGAEVLTPAPKDPWTVD